MTDEIHSRRAILTGGAASIAAVSVYGDNSEPTDEAAVRQVIAAFAAAWSRHDVQGTGALHTENVNFTNIWGSWLQGRKATDRALPPDMLEFSQRAKWQLRSSRFDFLRPLSRWHSARWNCSMFLPLMAGNATPFGCS